MDMVRRIVLVLVLTGLAVHADARTRAIRHRGSLPVPRSVLWIAAHPDDEAVVAPLLAQWCRDDRARCGLLVLTRGEAGPCMLADGCHPDVATIRSAEAGAASELFHAESILLRYADGGGSLPPRWEASGDEPAPAMRIAAHIAAFAPALVLTFDPRHGTSCHPDHREAGRLVLEAVATLAKRPAVYLLETWLTYETGTGVPQFAAALPGAIRFDATQRLLSGDEAWSAVGWDMERHPSQFPPALVEIIRHVPPDQRAVYLAPAEDALQTPLAMTCP